jgi:hypothetical protein
MFDSYPDIEYDAKTRRINRWMKALGVLIVLALFGGLVAIGAAVEANLPQDQTVFNDTDGTVSCFQRFSVGEGATQVRESGRLQARERESVGANSRCMVFDRSGDYVGCLIVRDRPDGGELLASSGDRRVKAAGCVYPR